MMAKKAACLFCGKPATLLCDGWLGFPPHREEPDKIYAFEPYTCDAPMCAECATNNGHYHFRIRGRCHVDTTDYCPVCADLPRASRRIIHSPDQASTIRMAHWNSYLNDYRRQLIAIQGGGQQCLPF